MDVLAEYDSESVRYFLISAHYRSQLNYSKDNLEAAKASLSRLYTSLRGMDTRVEPVSESEYRQRFIRAMDDDFNAPEALSVLFDMVKVINTTKADDPNTANQIAAELVQLAEPLGILQTDPETWLQGGAEQGDSDDTINALIEERTQARANKDWVRGDEIRDQLSEMGITLEDTPSGTIWRR